MPSNNDILLKLGVDQEGLDKVSASIGKAISKGLSASLKEIDISKMLKIGRIPIEFNFAATQREADRVADKLKFNVPVKFDLSTAKKQIEDFAAGLKPLEMGVKATQASTQKNFLDESSFLINPGVIDRTTQQVEKLKAILVSLGRTEEEAAAEAKPFEAELNVISNMFEKVRLEHDSLNKALRGSGQPEVGLSDTQIKNLNKADILMASLQTKMRDFGRESITSVNEFTPTIDKLNSRSQALRTTLNEEFDALEKLKGALNTEGVELSKVEKVTQSFQQALTSSKVKLDQLDAGLKEDKPDLDALGRSFNTVGVAIDTTARKMGEMDAKQVALNTRQQQSDAFMKNFAFSVGLVGYGMENLGRRLLGFSESMLSFVQSSAHATESLERLRNSLIVAGTPEDEAKSIENRILKIANLPGAKLETIAKGFREIRAAGLGIEDTLNLLQGLAKGTALAGTGTEGLTKSVDILRDALNLNAHPFKTQGVRTLEREVGRPIVESLEKAFGGSDAPALNAAGGKAAVAVVTDSLLKLNDALPVTLDRMNRIENSFTVIRANLEAILGPALDRLLEKLQSFEDISARIKVKFDGLSDPTKNFISGLLSAIPVALAALGSILSVLGVLAVGLAVGGKLWRAYGFIVGEAGTATAGAAAEFGFLGSIGARLSGVFSGILTPFEGVGSQLGVLGSQSARAASAFVDLSGETSIFARVLASIFKPIVYVGTLLKNLLFGISPFMVEGPKVIGVLEIFGGTFEGIAASMAKVVGLSNPIGWIINILLAYATNAGKARDNINASFSVLFTSFGKLFEQISTFVSGPTGSAIFGFLSKLIDFLGGILGDVISTIILELSSIIDVITSFFGLFTNPSLDSISNFFSALFKASVGWVSNLGNLLAASFLDAVADLNPQKGVNAPTTADVVFAGLPSATKNAFGNIGGADFFHSQADLLRNKVFGDTGDKISGWAKELKNSQAEVKNLNIQLNKTRDILNSMDSDWAKLSTNAINFSAKLARQNAEDEAKRADKAAQTRLGIETQANPTLALQDIPGVFQKSLDTTLGNIRNTTVDQVKQLATQLSTVVANLEASMEAATGVAGSAEATQAKLNYLEKLRELIQFARSGNIDPKAVQNLINSTGQAEAIMSKLFGSIKQSDEGLKQLKEVTKATGDVTSAVGEYQKALQANQESERGAINTSNDSKDAAIKAAQEQQRKTKAVADARTPQLEYNKALAEYNRLLGLYGAEVNPARRTALGNQVAEQSDLLNNLKNVVDKALHAGEASDSLKQETDKTNEALEKQNQTLQLTVQNTDSLTKNVQSLVGAFRASFNDIDAFKQKLDALNESRAKLGLGAVPTDILSNLRQRDIGAGAATTIKPLLTENRQVLGVDNRANLLIENALDVIRKGNALSGTIVTVLQGVGESTISEQLDLSKQIDDNNDTIALLKRALEDATGTGREDEARKNLDLELERQTQLGVKAAAHKNIIQAINILLQANTSIVGEQYRQQILQNQADQENLKLKQEQLQLESDLLDKQIENQDKRSSLPTDLAGAGMSSAEINAAEEQALRNQIALIQAKYELEVKSLEAKKLQLDADLASAKITQEEHDNLAAIYDREISLLGQINDQNKNSASLDNTVNKINKLKSSLNNLTSGLMDRVANDFVAMIGKIKNAAGKGVTAVTMFKDLAAAAIAGFGQALGQALVDVIANGENFFKSLGKFFGQILIQLGTMLISVGTAALAAGILSKFFPFLMPILNPSGIGEGAAVAAIAVGAGLVAAGALMGGGGGAKSAANTNASNSANSSAGASPQEKGTYDPMKDPKLAYQRAQTTQVYIDIRTDDGVIINKVIKAVNENGRLSNLIGNRHLGFSV